MTGTRHDTIGKYEIRRQIGRGAMGVVYEAFDPVIQRRVAIKVLRHEVFEAAQLADLRARFTREAQLAGQMSHPHIVTVYDCGEHEGTPYIVMEYMTGSELSRLLERGTRLPVAEVARIMAQLLGALSYAHERKVVHRDIKPGNLFVLEDGSVKVVDFGIARLEASNLTQTGAILGTPAYMSPEQFLALPIDDRSDLFSAGVILYELLTGDKPFTGSPTTIMQKVLHQEPIVPSMLNPFLSEAWDAVVRQAIAKRPEARFQSAQQFAATVKLAIDPRSELASAEATLPGPASAPTSHPPVAVSALRAASPGRSRLFPVLSLNRTSIALVVVLFALIGQSAYLLLRAPVEEARPTQERSAPPGEKIMVATSQEVAKSESSPALLAAASKVASAPVTRSEREGLAAQSGTQVASASPGPASASAAPSAGAAVAPPSTELFKQAEALEASDPRAAIKIYRTLARKGDGKAAKRLGDIYDHGIPGVARDYQESLSWYQKARDLGEQVEAAGKR